MVETPTERAIRFAVAATRTRYRGEADTEIVDGYRNVANAQSALAAAALADMLTSNDLDPDDSAEAAA